MATITSAGSGLWSATATWVGGSVPVDDDSVVIASGHTVEFDVDTSGFANGIAGITVTGTLSLTRTAGTYYLKMKAATQIAGAGTFDCGTALSPIPFAAKHTITGGAFWYINGKAGLTMTVYAAEPTIKTILLSGAEAAGQTELSVDTDVTGDIWAAGDLVRIANIEKAAQSELRTIDAAGIAAGTITVTDGLTANKSAGAVVSLMTRNVYFLGLGGATCKNFASEKLTIAGGQWASASSQAVVDSCTLPTISGGAFTNATTNSYILIDVTGAIVTGGVFAGFYALAANVSNLFISGGSFTGCTNNLVQTSVGASISGGTFKGNRWLLSSTPGSSISGGTFFGNTYPVYQTAVVSISGGTFDYNTSIFYRSSGTIKGASFSNSTIDMDGSIFNAYNVLFSTNQVTNYTSLTQEIYSESINHNRVEGAFKAWTRGGVTSSVSTPVPSGIATVYNIALESADYVGFWQREVSVPAGASVKLTSYLRKDAAMAYLPRVQVFNKTSTDPFAGGTPDHEFIMTDSVDTYETDTYIYSNDGTQARTIIIRVQGKNATGNVYSWVAVETINVDLTTALASLALIQAVTDQFVFTVANQVDANALTGGTSAEAIRIEMDANSTQLAAIVEDTGTTLPDAIAAIDFDTTGITDAIDALQGADGDTLETLSDQMDAVQTWTATNIAASRTAGEITQTRGDSWTITIPNLTLDANKIQFAIKLREGMEDYESMLFIDTDTGLIYADGKAVDAADNSKGSLSYVGTTLTVTVHPSIAKLFSPSANYLYGIQSISAAGVVLEPYGGTFPIDGDIVRAVA